jgi:hypothetical protein
MFLDTDRAGERVQSPDILGNIRPEPADPLYAKRYDYYLNCLRDVDRNIVPLLDELDVSACRRAPSSC